MVRKPQLVKKVSMALPFDETTVLTLYKVGSSIVHNVGLVTGNKNLPTAISKAGILAVVLPCTI